jgi:hypothetical protein
MRSEQPEKPNSNGESKTMRARKSYCLLSLVFFFLCASKAPALTIDTHYIGGEAPANAAGRGNLNDIVNAAARIWASAYSDSMTLTLYYGWAATGDAATHTLTAQSVNPNREISGMILFNNNGSAPFYLDPTPDSNEEYRRSAEESQNLGGGYINVSRVLSGPVGEAAGRIDLLSVALHEIGHALGMSIANISFIERSETGVLSIVNDLPFKGTMIPLAYNNSGIVAHFDVDTVAYGSVMTGINGDERRMPSELDILANAQISSFSILTLHPQQTSQSDGSGGIGNRGSGRRLSGSRGISGVDRATSTKKTREIQNDWLRLRRR